MSTAQGVDHGRLVDHLTTGDIDQHGSALHRRKSLAVDHPVGLRRVRHAQDNIVSRCKCRMEIRGTDNVGGEQLRTALRRWMVDHGLNCHPESCRDRRDPGSHLASPNNRQNLARELAATIALPVMGLLLPLDAREVFFVGKHHQQGEFSESGSMHPSRGGHNEIAFCQS